MATVQYEYFAAFHRCRVSGGWVTKCIEVVCQRLKGGMAGFCFCVCIALWFNTFSSEQFSCFDESEASSVVCCSESCSSPCCFDTQDDAHISEFTVSLVDRFLLQHVALTWYCTRYEPGSVKLDLRTCGASKPTKLFDFQVLKIDDIANKTFFLRKS